MNTTDVSKITYETDQSKSYPHAFLDNLLILTDRFNKENMEAMILALAHDPVPSCARCVGRIEDSNFSVGWKPKGQILQSICCSLSEGKRIDENALQHDNREIRIGKITRVARKVLSIRKDEKGWDLFTTVSKVLMKLFTQLKLWRHQNGDQLSSSSYMEVGAARFGK